MQHRIRNQIKGKVGRSMQIVVEIPSPLHTSIKQVFKDNEVIDMTRAILSREIGEQPNQSDMDRNK
jgi:hypothetical protein